MTRHRGPSTSVGRGSATDAVLCPAPSMRPGAVVGCCVSLLAAGVLLARGFVGVLPSRPVYLALGGVLAGTALLTLVIDNVAVRVRAERPEHTLIDELGRCRRYGRPLALVEVRCPEQVVLQVVARLRTSDRAWRERGALLLLLTETDRQGAVRFATRLGGLVPLGGVRVASFPEDAVTAHGLVGALSAPEPVPAEG